MNQHNALFIIAGGCKDISGYFVGSFRNREDIVDILRLDTTK